MPGKRCPGCGEVKGAESFSRCKSNKDGLQSRCKACKRRHREENRNAIAEYHRRYYEENREEIAEHRRHYHKGNREVILERQRRHYDENREVILERDRRYREENREAIAEYNRRYRKGNREAILERQRRNYEVKRDITRESATRTGERYTPAEDAHILTSDESDSAMAVELGRTLNSVRERRKILRKKAAA